MLANDLLCVTHATTCKLNSKLRTFFGHSKMLKAYWLMWAIGAGSWQDSKSTY